MQHPSSSLEVSFLQIEVNSVCDDIKRLSDPIPIAFSLFYWDLFSLYGSDSKNGDFHRCSIRFFNMRKPRGPLSLQHWTLMWGSVQNPWFCAQAVCILTCSTYSFYSAVYSGKQLLSCCRGKQPSKFQAAALSPGFHLGCCSFWSSSRRKIPASPPRAVLQVHGYTTMKELGVRVWLIFSFPCFLAPAQGCLYLSGQALLIPSVNISLLKHVNFAQSFTESCTVTIMLVSGLQIQHQLLFFCCRFHPTVL